ncbi:MAG: hypothetical protein ACI9EF_000209, partial [Pseudohongiellaceae bacterium]
MLDRTLQTQPEASASSLRRPYGLWLMLTAMLVVNELGTNLYKLWDRFHNAKVLNSLSDEARSTMEPVIFELVGMCLAALVMLAAVAAVATVFVDGTRRMIAPRWLKTRAQRMGFWALALLVVFNTWYSLNHLLVPSSGLRSSPLAILSGAVLSKGELLSQARLVTSLGCAMTALIAAVVCLVRSRTARRGVFASAAVLTVSVLSYSAWTAPGAPQQFTADGSVVMLGVDSLQANRLPHGGSPKNLAPRIEGFLANSQRFDNAWTPFARTYPSWLSLLSGRYPMNHGIRFNLLPDSYLADDSQFLPELLSDAGYSTIHGTDEVRFCILRERFGYQNLMHPPMGIRDFIIGGFFDFSAANLARQTHLGHDLFPAVAHNRAAVGYNSDIWVRDFLSQLNELPADKPVFISSHLCGNHWPFDTPAKYYWGHEEDVDSCVAMIDDQIGAILDYLDASGLSDRAVVTVLSDHGDGWSGDPLDTANTHGDNLLRLLANKVLLGVQGPGLQPATHDALVRTIDLYPTLLDMIGMPTPSGIDGRSLVPLIAGANDAPRNCFAESGFDKKTFTVAKLLEEQSHWYTFAANSGLVTLIPDSLEPLFAGKSYMVMDGDLRLLLVPARNEIRMTRFDSWSGVDSPADDVPDGVLQTML